MARSTYLVDIEVESIAPLRAAIKQAGGSAAIALANVDVPKLHKIAPGLLICDLDSMVVDSLERLRQIRFVLPTCIIVVYTHAPSLAWRRACHLAGANGLLSKKSTVAELASGLRASIKSGCYTDPNLAA